MLGLVFLVFALVLSICAAINWPIVPRPHLGWAAFAFFIAYELFGHGALIMGVR
jgi:hypothetical protein